MKQFTDKPSAPLWRRLAAMAYDSVLILAIWMVVAFVVLSLFGVEQARTVDGDAVVLNPLYKNVLFAAMILSAYAFFGWFWTHSGQTLGMQAWKIRVQNSDGSPISLTQSIIRFVAAPLSLLPLGLGYFYKLINKDGLTWHDKLSKSAIVQIRYEE